MVTDNERREVARRLRELEIGVIGTVIPTGELSKNILKEIDYCHSDAMTPYGRLADLIEPDSTIPTEPCEAALASVEGFVREMRHSTEEEQNEYGAMLKKMSVELYPVDRDALLAVADALSGDYRYEGNSIAAKQVVDAFNREHYEFARRIREAIGNGV